MTGGSDEKYMGRAIELAYRGAGRVNPNPLVGAVIVKEGRVIGEGWHEYYGGLHAERNAFARCSEPAEGATLYVTLEPCCHYGKTPPCTEAVIEHKISRVVVGLQDPNPLVAGKGVQMLREAGIEVVTGVEESRIREMNRVFLKYITEKSPWVVMKTAMTLDGKIAAYSGDSKWVTGEEARNRVQWMRAECMGIMVGIGTAKADDPMLTCRLEGDFRQPVRIVVDSRAEIDLESKLVKTARDFRTIVAHTAQADSVKLHSLKDAGVETWLCEEQDGRVAVVDLLRQVGKNGIDSLLLEGGGELNYTFIKNRLVDEVCAFIAPKIVGGRDAKTPVEGDGFGLMNEAVELEDWTVEKIGGDLLVRGKINNRIC